MSAIASNPQAVRARIVKAASNAGRSPEEVELLAVSKTWPADCGLPPPAPGSGRSAKTTCRKVVDKALATVDLDLAWHFIGPLQSNKTRPVAEHFSWVHSIERLKIAERLSAQRPADLPPLQVCVQVNVSGEASKSGCMPDETVVLCRAIAALPRLSLRGLMAIPEPADDFAAQRAPFRRLREIFEQVRAAGIPLDTLSMGMSHDLEAAVAEGATIVRIGTAIFGERNYA